jgi:plastocyanin
MRHRARWVSLGVGVALMLTAAGCSSGGDEGPTTGQDGDVLPGTAKIGIADLAFEPSVLTVVRGTTEITITNSDSVDHTFTLDTGVIDEPISAGSTVKVAVTLENAAGFHCEIHPQMTGKLQVT